MASVTLEHIKKVYDKNVVAVHDFNLEIKDKEFVVFVGPSGCGKSTTLRMVAGLEDISGGTVEIDGVVVNDLQPRDRDIAMVFQNYALYPHMTVYDNIAFGSSAGSNVAVGLYNWLNKDQINSYYTIFCAGGVLVALPVTILFMCLQKYYVEGVTGGAVKG